MLRLALNIAGGLLVNKDVIARNVSETLPFMATENLLMDAVIKGGDRQALHERIRHHSLAVSDDIKAGGAKNDLLERLRNDPAFAGVDFDSAANARNFVGRAPEQVDEFIANEIVLIRRRHAELLNQAAEVTV